jgi:hypothetical protein
MSPLQARKIESWLVNVIVHSCLQEWVWGQDLFWIAFIATYLAFPEGNWPMWNSKILMDGMFIQGWFNQSGAVLAKGLPDELWEELCHVSSLFYPSILDNILVL